MNTHIDFEKSTETGRVVYKGTSSQRFMISVKTLFPGIVILIVSILFFLYVIVNGNTLVAGLAVIPIILIILSMTFINKLAKAEGSDLRKNQTEIVRLLLRKYPGIQRHNCSERMIVITRGPRTSVFDKEILILLENEHVYMNITMLGGGQLKYILFSIPNYFRSRAMLRSFYQVVKAQPVAKPRVVNNMDAILNPYK